MDKEIYIFNVALSKEKSELGAKILRDAMQLMLKNSFNLYEINAVLNFHKNLMDKIFVDYERNQKCHYTKKPKKE